MNGARVSLAQSVNAGRLTLLLIAPDAETSPVRRAFDLVKGAAPSLQERNVRLFAITPQDQADVFALTARLDPPFPLLSDPAFALGRALRFDPSARGAAAGATIVLVNPNQRVARIADLRGLTEADVESRTREMLGVCGAWLDAQTPVIVNGQAPVLIVPDVLTPDHCARLMRHWETGQRYEGGVASGEHGRNVPIAKVKVREDVALADLGPEAQELFAVFRRRLFPQIRKAFNFRVTRSESLRIGCYDGADGGHFTLHRDDTTPYTAHRRFAMSLNLNTGAYEGGYLQFPEFGPQRYSVPTGGAIIFSCSLLHEATRITAGKRFVLLGFFYGEAEQVLRDRLAAERGAGAAPAGAPSLPRQC